jgi:hypothetical protein
MAYLPSKGRQRDSTVNGEDWADQILRHEDFTAMHAAHGSNAVLRNVAAERDLSADARLASLL